MNAASEWRTDEPPKDGTHIIGMWRDEYLAVVVWDNFEQGWYKMSGRHTKTNPKCWAHINLPSEA